MNSFVNVGNTFYMKKAQWFTDGNCSRTDCTPGRLTCYWLRYALLNQQWFSLELMGGALMTVWMRCSMFFVMPSLRTSTGSPAFTASHRWVMMVDVFKPRSEATSSWNSSLGIYLFNKCLYWHQTHDYNRVSQWLTDEDWSETDCTSVGHIPLSYIVPLSETTNDASVTAFNQTTCFKLILEWKVQSYAKIRSTGIQKDILQTKTQCINRWINQRT